MPKPSRAQLVVYVALALTALLLGARWIRSAEAPAAGASSSSAEGGVVRVERGGGTVVVHVAGEVERPGVYRLPAQARVADAVKRAGGVTRNGALDAINLAARLADGQQIVVPARAPAAGGASAASASASAADPDAPISLGTATVEQLDTIEGIGPVTAQKIIEFRDSRGGLSSIDELDQIEGIGPATMEALRARLQP